MPCVFNPPRTGAREGRLRGAGLPSRRAPRESSVAEGLPCSAGPRSSLPAPPLLQVTHQDAHHIGPEPGERLRHAGGRLGLRRGLRLRSRAGCSRVLHGCVPHAGRASRGWGTLAPHQRALGPRRRVPACCVTEPRPRSTSPRSPGDSAGAPRRRPHPEL